MDILRVLDPVALQGAEVVAITKVYKELLEDCPITIAAAGPELALKMAPKIGLDAVVVSNVLSTSTRKTVGSNITRRPPEP